MIDKFPYNDIARDFKILQKVNLYRASSAASSSSSNENACELVEFETKKDEDEKQQGDLLTKKMRRVNDEEDRVIRERRKEKARQMRSHWRGVNIAGSDLRDQNLQNFSSSRFPVNDRRNRFTSSATSGQGVVIPHKIRTFGSRPFIPAPSCLPEPVQASMGIDFKKQ